MHWAVMKQYGLGRGCGALDGPITNIAEGVTCKRCQALLSYQRALAHQKDPIVIPFPTPDERKK